jgi:Kef-type K+ transport system membrane component KefB
MKDTSTILPVFAEATIDGLPGSLFDIVQWDEGVCCNDAYGLCIDMSHREVINFFLQVSAMLLVALVFGQCMRKLRQPAVFGELLGGVIIGPTVFSALFPHAFHWLFPAGGSSLARETVIKIGMLFFLFVAGIEVNLAHLARHRASAVLTSILSIALPFGFGFAAVVLMPGFFWRTPHEGILIPALFLGTALSISALPVIARILMDLDLIRDETGVIIMASATVNDLIGWSLFAVILASFVPGYARHGMLSTLGCVSFFVVLILILGRWVGRCVLRWSQKHLAWPSGYIGIVTVLILAAGALAEFIGIHAIFGAFLLGVALGQHIEEENHAHEVIHQFALSFFAPLYFVSIGLKVDFAAHFDPGLTLAILGIACIGKIGGATIGARLGGMPLRESLAIGFGMNARGAIEMVLASVALDYGLIDQRIFVALIFMALATSLMTGPAMKRLLPRHTDMQGL